MLHFWGVVRPLPVGGAFGVGVTLRNTKATVPLLLGAFSATFLLLRHQFFPIHPLARLLSWSSLLDDYAPRAPLGSAPEGRIERGTRAF